VIQEVIRNNVKGSAAGAIISWLFAFSALLSPCYGKPAAQL